MRILFENDVFSDVLRNYMVEKNLKGCIVMRNACRKKFIKEMFRKCGVAWNARLYGDVVVFIDTRSTIHLKCLAQRPTLMYDEVIIDNQISDEDAVRVYAEHEYKSIIEDLGEMEMSAEILEYIGGLK